MGAAQIDDGAPTVAHAVIFDHRRGPEVAAARAATLESKRGPLGYNETHVLPGR
jgi:hypothetical protein